MRAYLKTQYDTRKSFSNKAEVEILADRINLYSYLTLVATIKDGEATVLNLQSNITCRHVKEFLLQNGFVAINKKQIEKDYHTKEEII